MAPFNKMSHFIKSKANMYDCESLLCINFDIDKIFKIIDDQYC